MSFIAEIPYGVYWSTPFVRWQGSFSHLHSIEFAAWVTKNEMARRNIDPAVIDYGVLGTSVPQNHVFYGLPWLTGMAGMLHVGGPTLAQACATSVRSLLNGAQEIQAGLATAALVVCADRLSNGPQIYYPNPAGPGGTGNHENWTRDNMMRDPLGGHTMLSTAENVARDGGFSTEAQHELVLRRQEQYADALASDKAFLKRFMTLPFEVPSANYKKIVGRLESDEGVVESTAAGLAKLRPVMEGGTITYGGQTHPADGNAAIIMATPEKARELSTNRDIVIKVRGFGQARVELGYMPKATVPAARQALAQAGLTIDRIDAVKTHNPFVVSDLFFAKETGIDVMKMNNFGCSLVWGHPQGPMGLRGVMEIIEELVKIGGGYGLFTGCAAGDSAMAMVIEVSGKK